MNKPEITCFYVTEHLRERGGLAQLQLHVGCSGFGYSSWSGHFYPSTLDANKYLEYYSKVFEYVEIEASFYRAPHVMTVTKWAKITPENFRFTAKMPQKVTHEKRLDDGMESSLRSFYEAMTSLKDKMVPVLLQLPPSTAASPEPLL